jgi:hypothetical protein
MGKKEFGPDSVTWHSAKDLCMAVTRAPGIRRLQSEFNSHVGHKMPRAAWRRYNLILVKLILRPLSSKPS